MKNRIVIIVRGGNIQAAYARRPLDVDIEVIDIDNLQADGFGSSQIENLIAATTSGLELIP